MSNEHTGSPKDQTAAAPLLDVRSLETTFRSETGEHTYLDDVSFQIHAGEIVGLVGESGSGKSITSLSIMGLLSSNGYVSNGEVLFEGQDLLKLSDRQMDEYRGNQLTMIFQDAQSSLNPSFTVGFQIRESLLAHHKMSKKEAKARTHELLAQVGLPQPERVARSFPHTLSGGMRQRVMIAMALAGQPKLLIADEPTTALDVTIQAQIIQLLEDLNEDLGMAILFITHDLGVIAQSVDRVLVMYAGQIVETAEVYTLFENPLMPYTRQLLKAIPSLEDDPDLRLEPIEGTVPEEYDTISGCRFYSRCEYARPSCKENYQPLTEVVPGRQVRCERVLDNSLPWTDERMRDPEADPNVPSGGPGENTAVRESQPDDPDRTEAHHGG